MSILNVLVHNRREKVEGRVIRICLREMYLVSLGCKENGDMTLYNINVIIIGEPPNTNL
jgi:hypothetical protein